MYQKRQMAAHFKMSCHLSFLVLLKIKPLYFEITTCYSLLLVLFAIAVSALKISAMTRNTTTSKKP